MGSEKKYDDCARRCKSAVNRVYLCSPDFVFKDIFKFFLLLEKVTRKVLPKQKLSSVHAFFRKSKITARENVKML